jgi:tyrosyl-DNA phosphodiesterase-1
MTEETGSAPPAKRRKLQSNPLLREATTRAQTSLNTGIDRPISPPSSRRYIPVVASSAALSPTWRFDDVPQQTTTSQVADVQPKTKGARDGGVNYVPSPVQLTRIKDLAPHQNVNTVGLKDILGDPMIKECWNFNFLFDLDFVM